jgi:hypothetical protein
MNMKLLFALLVISSVKAADPAWLRMARSRIVNEMGQEGQD